MTHVPQTRDEWAEAAGGGVWDLVNPAIEIANSMDYAVAPSLWTSDLS